MTTDPESGWSRLARHRPSPRRMVQAAIFAVAAFAVGYLVTALLFFGGGPRGPVVTVPDVRNLTEAQARRMLGREALGIHVADSLPNARVRRGAVLVQSPLPGREVAPESDVRVILSLGAEQRAIPEVESYTPAQAARILEASGFQVVQQPIPDARAQGRVVGTQPAAGAAVPLPATVRLLVSSGPPLVATPGVVGMLEGEALVALATAGLRPGDIGYELRPELAEGLVLSQFPAAGDSVRAGTGVTLGVAIAAPRPEPVEAPVPMEPPEAEPAPPAGESEVQ